MTSQDNFAVRFAKHKDELEWLFMELYRVPGRGKSGRSGWRVSHPGGHFCLAGGCGAGTLSGAAGKKQISKMGHPALSFRQSFHCVFLHPAESGVLSKLFVDTARFLW